MNSLYFLPNISSVPTPSQYPAALAEWIEDQSHDIRNVEIYMENAEFASPGPPTANVLKKGREI